MTLKSGKYSLSFHQFIHYEAWKDAKGLRLRLCFSLRPVGSGQRSHFNQTKPSRNTSSVKIAQAWATGEDGLGEEVIGKIWTRVQSRSFTRNTLRNSPNNGTVYLLVSHTTRTHWEEEKRLPWNHPDSSDSLPKESNADSNSVLMRRRPCVFFEIYTRRGGTCWEDVLAAHSEHFSAADGECLSAFAGGERSCRSFRSKSWLQNGTFDEGFFSPLNTIRFKISKQQDCCLTLRGFLNEFLKPFAWMW